MPTNRLLEKEKVSTYASVLLDSAFEAGGQDAVLEVRDQAEAGETVVVLPPDFAPEGKVVVARPEALDLVSYLKSLKRNYPAVDAASVK